MAVRRPKPEEIVVKLRQVEVLMGQGMPRIDAIRQKSPSGGFHPRSQFPKNERNQRVRL
jgi:hypothetical protein